MDREAIIVASAQLAQRAGRVDAPVIIDVRLEDDCRACHLPGARSNCVFEVAFLERMTALAPEKQTPVCVYGESAGSFESRMAAGKLVRAGYRDVLDLREGIEGWKAAGLPIENGQTVTIPNPQALNGRRDIDLGESRVEWLGRNLLNKHFGSIGLKSGWLEFAAGRLVSGAFVIDMRTIACDDLAGGPLHDVLVAHLQSDDFFDVELYPEATFAIVNASMLDGAGPGAPNLHIRGELTLKDVTRCIEFTATTGLTDDGRPAAQAAFPIDRTEWNVLYGSGKLFHRLAGHLVNDLIELQFRIVAR